MDPLPRGAGALYTDPSADRARAWFAGKPRAMTDKLTSVREAVARLVKDGDYLAIGGFGADRIPTAVVHEILRQGQQHLSVAGHTATHDFQILCAGNLTGRGKTLARLRKRRGRRGECPRYRRRRRRPRPRCCSRAAWRYRACAPPPGAWR